MKSRKLKSCFFHFQRARTAILAGLLLVPFMATTAAAQSGNGTRKAIGEDYHFETTFAWWKPGLFGGISSDRLDLIGSRVDLVNDSRVPRPCRLTQYSTRSGS